MTKLNDFLNELAQGENVSAEMLTKINDCKNELAENDEVLKKNEIEISTLKNLVVENIKNGGSSKPEQEENKAEAPSSFSEFLEQKLNERK